MLPTYVHTCQPTTARRPLVPCFFLCSCCLTHVTGSCLGARRQISDARKPLLYNHIYSYSSVKSVVHWFQIIRCVARGHRVARVSSAVGHSHRWHACLARQRPGPTAVCRACGRVACRSGRFQMFDDAPSSHRVPPMYDVRNITTVPVALFVGGKDTIIDPPRLISLLPPTTVVHHLPR